MIEYIQSYNLSSFIMMWFDLVYVLQEHFQKYYDAVMPYLKAILVNANDKSNRMLRAKSMECISLVGMAVGKEKFRDDAKQVSNHNIVYLFMPFMEVTCFFFYAVIFRTFLKVRHCLILVLIQLLLSAHL